MSAKPIENPKKNVGYTLDQEIVEMLARAAELQAKLRHSSPKVSPYLNELLHRTLPDEVKRLEAGKDP